MITPLPWTNVDEKRGKKKAVWQAETAREVFEDEWGPNYGHRPSRYGPQRVDVANFFNTEDADFAIRASNNYLNLVTALSNWKSLWDSGAIQLRPGVIPTWLEETYAATHKVLVSVKVEDS